MESDRGTVSLDDIIKRSAKDGTELQRDDGSFPPGRNYTYDEPETPVRTTSHWLRILTKAYEITGEEILEEAANQAVDYLLSDSVRPSGFTYHCRNVESKDKCNGLVGQAAPIRALLRASEVFSRQDAKETAKEVFLLHPFSENLGLWERMEIDGQTLSFDRTLNHQIIFAASSTGLVSDLEAAEYRIERFLDALENNMRLHSNGLIKHYARPPVLNVLQSVIAAPRRRDMLINEVAFHYYSRSAERRKKERGYQTVNLVSLSKLKDQFPSHEFWESNKFYTTLEFLRNNERELIAGDNMKHGHPLQGVAIAKIRHRIEEDPIENLQGLVSGEISMNVDGTSGVFELEDIDENTQTALVSELIDLPDVKIR